MKMSIFEDRPRRLADFVGIIAGNALFVVPKLDLRCLALEGPFELLADRRRIDDAFAAEHHIGVQLHVATEDLIALAIEVFRHLAGKAAAEGGDVVLAGNEGGVRKPALADIFIDGVGLGDRLLVGEEIGGLATIPGRVRFALRAAGLVVDLVLALRLVDELEGAQKLVAQGLLWGL